MMVLKITRLLSIIICNDEVEMESDRCFVIDERTENRMCVSGKIKGKWKNGFCGRQSEKLKNLHKE